MSAVFLFIKNIFVSKANCDTRVTRHLIKMRKAEGCRAGLLVMVFPPFIHLKWTMK